jgi:hypothetical protein
VSDGFLHFLQRLFGLGGDRPKQTQPAQPSKNDHPSHAPKRKGRQENAFCTIRPSPPITLSAANKPFAKTINLV